MQSIKTKTQINIKDIHRKQTLLLARGLPSPSRNSKTSSNHVHYTQVQICISSSKISLSIMLINSNSRIQEEWEIDSQSSSSSHHQESAWLQATLPSTTCPLLHKLSVLEQQEATSSSPPQLTVRKDSKDNNLCNTKVSSQTARALPNRTTHRHPT